MKRRLILLIAVMLAAIQCYSQTGNLPSSMGVFDVFREASLKTTIIMPSGYTIPTPVKVELWNNGVKLSDSTGVTISGDTIKFTITKTQIYPLIKTPYLFVKFNGTYVLGAPMNVKLGVAVPSTQTVDVAMPTIGSVRISLIGDASTAIAAANVAIAQKDLAVAAKVSAEAAAASAIATLASHIQSGTQAQLRASTGANTAWIVVYNGESRIFYRDASDTTTPDDTAMTVVRADLVRFKYPFDGYACPEWFGVTPTTTFSNETTKMMRTVNYLKSKGGGILKLRTKIYCGDLKWLGSDNISIEGLGKNQTGLRAGSNNKFAVFVDGPWPSPGLFIKNLRFYGSDDVKRHGIYINVGSGYVFDNVMFTGCGIGACFNGTIDNSFNQCDFRGCYIAVMFTCLKSGDTVIDDINGQSVTLSPVFYDTQQSEQTFTSCQWTSSKIQIYLSYKGTENTSAINVKLFGGALQNAVTGIYTETPTSLLSYSLSLNGVWIENDMTQAAVVVNGDTLPKRDIVVNGGTVDINSGGLGSAHVGDNTIMHLRDCTLHGSNFTQSGTGTYTGDNITGDEIFFPYNITTGANDHGSRAFGFYTSPKSTKTRSLIANKKYSESMGFGSSTTGFGATVTSIAGGFMDGKCWNVVAPSSGTGLISGAAFSITVDKVYVATFSVKTDGSPFSFLLAGTDVPTPFNLSIPVTNAWKTVAVVGRGSGTGTYTPFMQNVSGSSKTWQVSGWQVLEFDNIGQAYDMLRSDAFVTDIIEPTMSTSNASTSVPSKANLNSAYGDRPNRFKASYPSISGGAREYEKQTDSSTSDWVETIWSSGNKSLAL